jgi:hypothetical protein
MAHYSRFRFQQHNERDQVSTNQLFIQEVWPHESPIFILHESTGYDAEAVQGEYLMVCRHLHPPKYLNLSDDNQVFPDGSKKRKLRIMYIPKEVCTTDIAQLLSLLFFFFFVCCLRYRAEEEDVGGPERAAPGPCHHRAIPVAWGRKEGHRRPTSQQAQLVDVSHLIDCRTPALFFPLSLSIG